jgi:HEAT repeat protein
MKESTVFALHLARLLSQLLSAPDDDRGTHQVMDDLLGSTRGPVTLGWDNWQLVVDGETIHPSLPGVRDLTGRMAAHGVREIVFQPSPAPGEVMGALWILARDPVPGDGGADAIARLARFSVSRVRFTPVAASPRRVSNPIRTHDSDFGDTQEIEGSAILDGFELEEMDVAAPRRAPVPAPSAPVAAPSGQATTPEEALEKLVSTTSVVELSALLNQVTESVSGALAAREPDRAIGMVERMVEQEKLVTDNEAKVAYAFQLRRIGKTSLMREIARLFARQPQHRERFMSILDRLGDDAVDALIEQLVYAEQARERRALFDAIVELGRGVPTLIHMLDDQRWYVARNAAELLGRLKAAEAQPELAKALRHDEPRVRRSAGAALARIGTPAAMAVLRAAMRDPDSEVRMHAVLAASASREPAAVTALLQILDGEDDHDVRAALLTALGKIGSADAVERLIQEASPAEGRFKRKHAPTRLAATKALAESRSAEAIAALRNLSSDRDPDVRDAATKGLASRPPVGAGRGWWD